MTIVRKNLRVGVTLMILAASFSISACGKRLSPASIQQSPMSTQAPIQQPVPDPYPDYNNTPANNPITQGVPNAQSGSFPADQATFNQWQARGIAVTGGVIYLSVSDTSGLSKKGSIVKMNSSDGKNWKDLTSSFLGLSHPLDATVTGLAVAGGTIIAVDSNSKVYSVDASNGKVKVIKTAGGTDVTAGAGSVFIANGSVEKSDSSATARTPIMGLTASGGVGSDNSGNVYAVSGTTIKKADPQGQVQDVITTDLAAPVDVAVDSRSGDIYVLEQSMIKRFNSNGQLLVSFSNGATKAVSIAADETGAIYVADAGSTNKDSKVIKFAPAIDAMVNSQMNSSSYGYPNSASTSAYGSYGYGNTNTGYGNTGYANTNTGYNNYSNTGTSTDQRNIR
jgi:hypothetical protein